jgi:membrane associated rhomboid family serine protease
MSNLSFLIQLLSFIFMLPLKDRRQGRHSFPWATTLLVLSNILIHIGVTLIIIRQPNDSGQAAWLMNYPFTEVPALILSGQGLGALSVLTSGFLHAGIGHLLGNMFVLWFFGRKVEDSTGSIRFTLFYIFCLFTASLVSVIARASLSSFNAQIPGLGASGAITGVMAAYLFLYSEEKISTMITIAFIPLLFRFWLPSWVFILFTLLRDTLQWQLALEVARETGVAPTGVNVFAHLGGAAGGFLFIILFLHPDVFTQRR